MNPVKILHTSDVHGEIDRLCALLSRPDYDLWVDTGDLQPDRWREGARANFDRQQAWWADGSVARRLRLALADRPVVLCYGNHDHYEFGGLIDAHHVGVHQCAEVLGLRFAGFADTPVIARDYFPRQRDPAALATLVRGMVRLAPDVLMTHAPPSGPWSHKPAWGLPGLAEALQTSQGIQAHLCGHIHERGTEGPQWVGPVPLYNSARRHNLLAVTPRPPVA
ncbi:MAG: metallophosphoesterase [Myxococcales bacterium]|nr:metallophosphoesterase [Myxococcales bacterium]MCB9523404.1 metallophosphoesterase [Myxococcales bacterium]